MSTIRERSSDIRSPAALATLWAVLAGWAVMKLVARDDRHRPAPHDGPVDRRSGRSVAPRPSEKQHAVPQEAVAQEGRGRTADTPTKIPTLGWKDILWRTYEEFNDDRIMSVAAGVTYYALLALFPGIAALVSMYGLFADPSTIQDHLTLLSGVLPTGGLEIIGDQVKRIASHGGGALGFGFIFGLVLSLWSANAGMKSLIDALNVVYEEDEKRSFVKLNLISLTFTLGAIAFLLVAIGAVIVLPIVLDFVGLGTGNEWFLSIARWPALLTCVVLGLAVVFRYGPSRDKAEWKWVSVGSLVAAILWLVVSMLFSWYVASFGNYNETYGSLGAVIGFMTWIWISTTIILLGAEINAEMEHQTVADTTEGRDQPLGARGAQMADTVGVSKA